MWEGAHRSTMLPLLKLVYTFGETGSEAGAQLWVQAAWMGPQMNWTPQEMSGLLLVSELLQESKHIFN